MRCVIAPLLVLLSTVSVSAQTAPAPAKAPGECQIVEIKQPDMKIRRSEVNLTFRGDITIEDFKRCNTDDLIKESKVTFVSVAASPSTGLRVKMKVKDGFSYVSLPDTYQYGDVHQNYCDVKDGEIIATLFAVKWDMHLPAKVVLTDKSSELPGFAAERAKYLETCRSSAPAHVREMLKK